MAKSKNDVLAEGRPSDEVEEHTAPPVPDNVTILRDRRDAPEEQTISRKQWREEGDHLRAEGWYHPDDKRYDDAVEDSE